MPVLLCLHSALRNFLTVIFLLVGGNSCHFSAAAIAPKKKIQTTLTNLVVKGTDLIIQETQQKLGNFASQ